MTRLYAAQLVMVEERIWPDRCEESHYLELTLFAAEDDDAAYDRAVAMAAGLGDETHDGEAPRTRWHSPGIHELALAFEGQLGDLSHALGSDYGLDLGKSGEAIEVRPREQLALFRR